MLESQSASVLGEDIDALLLALSKFSDAKSFPTLRDKLTKWATAFNSQMSAEEVRIHLRQFAQALDKAQAVTEVPFDGVKVEALLAKIPKPFDNALRQDMIVAFPMLLRYVLEQAGLCSK